MTSSVSGILPFIAHTPLATFSGFIDTCRKNYKLALNSSEYGITRLGKYPERQRLFDMEVGANGIDVTETHNWRFNILDIKKQCGIDVFETLSYGFTDIFISGDNQHYMTVAEETLQGAFSIPTYRFLIDNDIILFALSYKHGARKQLTSKRLYDGICALSHFLPSGIQFILWIDLVSARVAKSKIPNGYISWLKHGLLPYQLFPVLCLDNSSSGRPKNDYVNSFWLNIEGVLATLGSGMIMVGPELKTHAVSSWLFEDDKANIPIEYVEQDSTMQIAFRAGSNLRCDESLKFLMRNAIKGAYDHQYVRYIRDRDDHICMANCWMHVRSWEDYGKLAYDPNCSNYQELYQYLTRELLDQTIHSCALISMQPTGRIFDTALGQKVSQCPASIENVREQDEESVDVPLWTPKHLQLYEEEQLEGVIQPVWLHFNNEGGVVAAIGIATTLPSGSLSDDGYLHVKILQVDESKNGERKVRRTIAFWDCPILSLLQAVLKMLEEQKMNLSRVQIFLEDIGIACGVISGVSVSQKFERIKRQGERIYSRWETLDLDIYRFDIESSSRVQNRVNVFGGTGLLTSMFSRNTCRGIKEFYCRMKVIEEEEPRYMRGQGSYRLLGTASE